MIKKNLIYIMLIGVSQICWAVEQAKIVKISGEVKVRRGVEEKWENAYIWMLLKPIDTILTGEQSEVVLELSDNRNFILGSNSMLDVGDLREISEKELFLFLMSTKIGNIAPREQKTPIRVGNVSVVHGEDKVGTTHRLADNEDPNKRRREMNGAEALHNQKYFSNAIIKLHKILVKYPLITDCGEMYYHLGKSFEAFDKPGQAIDAYQTVLNQYNEQGCEHQHWYDEAQKAIERLKSNRR